MYVADHEKTGGWVTHAYATAEGKLRRTFWVPNVRTFALSPAGKTALIENMTSLGGVTSRIEARARWEGDRVPPGLLRLSVGLEDADALWSDLERALGPR